MNTQTEYHPDVFDDINAMHVKYGFDKQEIDREQLKARIDFLQEELDEIKAAFEKNDAAEVVDGCIDLIVVAVGTLDLSKVDSKKAWKEVFAANMSKGVGKNEKRPGAKGVDLIKPKGWKAPNHDDNVGLIPQILLTRVEEQRVPEQIKGSLSHIELNDFDRHIEDLQNEIFLRVTGINRNKLIEHDSSEINEAINKFSKYSYNSIANPMMFKIPGRIYFVNKNLEIPDIRNLGTIQDARKELHRITTGFTFDDTNHKEICQIISNIDKVLAREIQKTQALEIQKSNNQFWTTRRFAIQFLENCKEFMMQKAADYNNEMSSVKSADYYERGVDDLLFNIREKYLRLKSVIDIMRNGEKPNFDTLQDTFRDLAIFSAMFAEFVAGEMDGQDTQSKDLFGRKIERLEF